LKYQLQKGSNCIFKGNKEEKKAHQWQIGPPKLTRVTPYGRWHEDMHNCLKWSILVVVNNQSFVLKALLLLTRCKQYNFLQYVSQHFNKNPTNQWNIAQ
jgi:hypothetical protein